VIPDGFWINAAQMSASKITAKNAQEIAQSQR